MVIHPSTNQVRGRATTLTEINLLLLSQTAIYKYHRYVIMFIDPTVSSDAAMTRLTSAIDKIRKKDEISFKRFIRTVDFSKFLCVEV